MQVCKKYARSPKRGLSLLKLFYRNLPRKVTKGSIYGWKLLNITNSVCEQISFLFFPPSIIWNRELVNFDIKTACWDCIDTTIMKPRKVRMTFYFSNSLDKNLKYLDLSFSNDKRTKPKFYCYM